MASLVGFATAGTDKGGTMYQIDVIWQGALWLVPHWLETPDRKERKPLRAICLSTLRHQPPDPKNPGVFGYVVNGPVPAGLLAPSGTPRAQGFLVIDLPEVTLPAPGAMN